MLIKKIWMILLAGFWTATISLQGAAPLSALIEEDVNLYISMPSLADSRTQWESHPLALVLDDPDFKEFLEPWLQDQAEVEEGEGFTEVLEYDFGLTWDGLFELFPGQISIAWFRLSELMLGQAERQELVLMAEYAGKPGQLTELMQVQFERNAEKHREINPVAEHTLLEESFMGETLYFDETFDGETTYIEDGYALVDGIFVLATPEERLRSAVEAIKEQPAVALNENSSYLRSREEGVRGDLEVYLNLEAMMPPLNAAFIQKLLENGLFMPGLNADSLNSMLSLESLQAFFMDVDLIDTGIQSHSGLFYKEKAGFLSLLTYTDKPLPEARFVPEGIFSSSITNYDLGEMFARLENLLLMANPDFRAQIDSQLQTIRTNTGVDLRSAILENLGNGMVSLSILQEGTVSSPAVFEADEIFVVTLEDAQAFSAALEALKDLVPGMREQIRTQNFAGQTIHWLTPPPVPNSAQAAGRAVSYVITRSHFILNIGGIGLLQEVLSSLESGEGGFWQRAETEKLFKQIERPGTVSRSYIDLEKWVLPIFQLMVQTSQFGGEDTALDMERIPKDLAVSFHLISETNEVPEGVLFRSFILSKEDSE